MFSFPAYMFQNCVLSQGRECLRPETIPPPLSVFLLSGTEVGEVGGDALNLVNTFGWFILSILTLYLVTVILSFLLLYMKLA